MKTNLLAVSGAVLSFAAAAAAPSAFDPKDGIVLPLDQATAVTHQCSRSSPGPVKGTWLPTAQEIRDLESKLPDALAHALPKRTLDDIRTHIIARQYAGLVIGTHKTIYVNAFPLHFFDEEMRAFPDKPPFDWKHKAVNVCDGGAVFFGVEYDPKTKVFVNFAFNGGG